MFRRTDPATSRLAAQAVNAESVRQIIVAQLLKSGKDGLTSLDVADHTGIQRVTVSPRFRELEKTGLIVRTTRRRQGWTGSTSEVWVAQEFSND